MVLSRESPLKKITNAKQLYANTPTGISIRTKKILKTPKMHKKFEHPVTGVDNLSDFLITSKSSIASGREPPDAIRNLILQIC